MCRYVRLLWQEWREAKELAELCPFHEYRRCIRRGEITRKPGKEMGVTVLSICVVGSPLVWCHTRHVPSRLRPPGLAGGSPGHAWWGCGVCIFSSAWARSLTVLQQSLAGLEVLPTAM